MNTLTDNFKNNISRLGYELYKNYRLFEHNREMLRGRDINVSEQTFDTDLYNHMYAITNKPLVKSYDAFFESDYLDENLMKKLFDTSELIEAYLKSVTEIKEYKDFATYSENDSIDEFKQRAYNIYHRYYNYDEPYDYFIEFVYLNEDFMRDLLRESTLIDKYYDSLKTFNRTDKSAIKTTDNISDTSIDIRHLAYALYKQDYLNDIPFEQRMDTQRNYTRYLATHPGISFNDYIINHGYPDAQIPLESYDEFIQEIYLSSQTYIKNLLNDEDLIDLYQKDIEENDNTSLPNAEDVRELLRTAKTEINKLSNYLYGKPDRPSDLMECGRIDGEYAVWDKILYILRPM